MRKEIIDKVFEVASEDNAFDLIEKYTNSLSKDEILSSFIQCGILPEHFSHNSSEEKIWSKYSDIILSEGFNYLGLESMVLGARGNSADVLAKGSGYSVVADAKTFRLSRTAKNQKDFKVTALDSWRRENNYSMLVGPLFQYPNTQSQIYKQAITKNVTLFSFTHLKALIDNNVTDGFEQLLVIGNELKEKVQESKFDSAEIYWKEIDEVVARITKLNMTDLEEYKRKSAIEVQQLANEGIIYWNQKIEEIKRMPKDEAIEQLIKARKIDNKIAVITRSREHLNEYVK